MKRKRGRPRKFQGDRDRATFPQALDATLQSVVDFIVLAQFSDRKKRGTHEDDRYQWALAAVANKYGIRPRTLERRCAELRFLAEPIAHEAVRQGRVPLEVEFLPKEAGDPPS